jgi:hypothetical protein
VLPNEFEAWTRETAASKWEWKVDEILLANRGELLAYKGGSSGQFVQVDKTGLVSVGSYEDAIPHIGEALFKVSNRIQIENFGAASARLFELMGAVAFRNFIVGA